jgi:hypothetical protein
VSKLFIRGIHHGEEGEPLWRWEILCGVPHLSNVVDLSKESASLPTSLKAKVDEGWLWHHRLGHINMRNLEQLLKGEHIVGLTGVTFEKDRVFVCMFCWEPTWEKASLQGRHHHLSSLGAPSLGSLWAIRL